MGDGEEMVYLSEWDLMDDNVGSGAAHLVFMGPAGCGKSTLGLAWAKQTGALFVDADDHHSLDAKEKMRRGEALTDEDRAPWLKRLRQLLESEDSQIVLACSALKRNYREKLRPRNREVRVFYIHVPAHELKERLEARENHFAGSTLLESQLEALEKPPRSTWLDGRLPVSDLCTQVRVRLR